MRNVSSTATLIGVLLCVLLSHGAAQEQKAEQDLFQLSLKELMSVVVTPSKLPQAIGNVTQKVDVVSEDDIEATVLGNRNLCEAIARLPGASICVLSRNDANWGTYGGIGPKYSTYLLQGLSIDAFVDPMSLDLNACERIEVQRGPASVFYPNYLSQDFAGNQSPLAGTINLILKQKIDRPRTSFKTSFGSYNTLDAQIFHQGRKDRLNYFCGSSFEMSDYANYAAKGSWLNMTKDPEYRKTKLFGGVTLFLDDREQQKLTIFCHGTWHSGDLGRVYQGFVHEYRTANVGYDVALSDRVTMQSHVGLRSYDRSWQESTFGDEDTLTSDNGVYQMIVPADVSLSWRHGEAHMLSAGVDYQGATYYTWSDPLIGSRLYGNKSTAMQAGIYVQEELRPTSTVTLRGGLRFTSIRNQISQVNGSAPTRSSESWRKVLWSIGARYALSGNAAVYANGGSSFAVPGLKSSGGTIPLAFKGGVGHDGQLPNPDLTLENGVGVDAGIELTPMADTKIGIRGFSTTVRDAIIDVVVSKNPSQTQSINTGSSTATGVEFEIAQLFSNQLSCFANLTYVKTAIHDAPNDDAEDLEIPFSPKAVVNLGGSFHLPGGPQMTLLLGFSDGFFDGTSRAGRTFYKPGVVVNVYIDQRLVRSDACVVDCFVQLYNITDNTYEMPWQFANPGFSGMCGTKVTF